jgi:hypothetical protein
VRHACVEPFEDVQPTLQVPLPTAQERAAVHGRERVLFAQPDQREAAAVEGEPEMGIHQRLELLADVLADRPEPLDQFGAGLVEKRTEDRPLPLGAHQPRKSIQWPWAVHPRWKGISMRQIGPWLTSSVSKIRYSPRFSAHHDTGTIK